MAQTKLDQVLADLAGTRDDFDARRDVLERAAHLLLHKTALGGQLIARVCAAQEDDLALEDLFDLGSIGVNYACLEIGRIPAAAASIARGVWCFGMTAS